MSLAEPDVDGLRRLVDQALAGDGEAAGELYTKFYATVLAMQLRYTGGDRVLATDLTQDTFVKALYRLNQFRWTGPSSLRGWLATVARNTFLDHVRTAAVQRYAGHEVPETASPDEHLDPEAVVLRDLEGVCLQVSGLLEKLKPEHQLVLRRMIGDGVPARQLAAELGRYEAAVHQLRLRALEAARRVAARTGIAEVA